MKAQKSAFTVGEVLSASWGIVKRRWLLFLAVGVIMAVFVGAYLLIFELVTRALFLPIEVVGWLHLAAVIALIGYLLVFGARVLLMLVQDKPLDLSAATQIDASMIGGMLAGSVLFKIMKVIGTLLLVIPGILAHIIFQFYAFIIVDKKNGPIISLEQCLVLTQGSRLQIFETQLLIGFAGFFAATIPVVFAAFGAAAFRNEGPFAQLPTGLLVFEMVISGMAFVTIVVLAQMMAHAATGYMYVKMRSRLPKMPTRSS